MQKQQQLISVWAEFKQSVIDKAINQWRPRLKARVRASGQHFERLINWNNCLSVERLFLQGHFFVRTSNLKTNFHIVPFQFVKNSYFMFLKGSVATLFRWSWKILLYSVGVGGCVHAGRPEVVTLNICNWPVLFRATHILQEKTHACDVVKRHNFRVHVSLGSAETLVRRGEIINHHSIAYSLSNICAKNYRNRLMWVESIVCNISVVFRGTV